MMYLPLPDLLDNGVSYTRQDIKHTPFIYTRYTLSIFFISYFYSTTKHEIIQTKNYNLLCSLDPPNQSWLF